MTKTAFQQSALASGLVLQEDIDQALAELRESSRKSGTPITDERLGETLVAMGRINRWQLKELRDGHTKFTLGPYHCIDSIGHGGMAEVYKAEHSIMGRVVAVKVLPRHKTTPETIASFMREIRTQAQLDHPNLVRAFDAGQDGNVHFLVTEYVPGMDLRRLVRRHGRLQAHAAASIIVQAARGLEHAHSRGLIHRDVKPGNILVSADGHTKVSDLGLSGYFHDAEQLDARGAKVVGTADYLAPEQITSPDRLTPASDLYALGCTLYYSVTGKVPFPGGSARDKARAHIHLPPLDPRRLAPDLQDEFVDVIADMMAKSPGDRIQTAAEVVTRLGPWATDSLSSLRSALVPGHAAAPTAGRRPLPLVVPDTEPNFLVQPADEYVVGESTSQVSLGTHPGASASEETLPVFHEPSVYPASYRLGGNPAGISFLVWAGIGTVALLSMALLIRILS